MFKTTGFISFFMLIQIIFLEVNAFSAVRHELFTKVLSNHVTDSGINYAELCHDPQLYAYTRQLNDTDLQSFSEQKEIFAFWLNVYNAYSLEAICKKYPIKNINQLNFGGLVVSVLLKKSVWDRPFVKVDHKAYTLRQVDHDILRARFKDPRIQFAIACGAVGCAPSRQEAYEADTLEGQLEDQARRFVNDAKINTFDQHKKIARLSPLFNWSRKDFPGETDKELLIFIASYLPAELKDDILAHADSWDIIYNSYDLSLRDDQK